MGYRTIMSYKTIYDFVMAHTRPTEGKIRVVEDGKEMFLAGEELKAFCDGLKERMDRKEIRVFVEETRVVVRSKETPPPDVNVRANIHL